MNKFGSILAFVSTKSLFVGRNFVASAFYVWAFFPTVNIAGGDNIAAKTKSTKKLNWVFGASI